MIQIKARKQGGAVIITIPAGLLKLRGIKAGDALDLDVTPDGFVIRKVEAAINPNNAGPMATPTAEGHQLMVSGGLVP